MQIKYVKTVVGWYNVYINNEIKSFNISPDKFFEIFEQVDRRATLGCLVATDEQLARIA